MRAGRSDRVAGYAIGVDVGGTFTDGFVTDGVRSWRGKAPTTPRSLVEGVVAALEATAAAAGRPLAALLAETAHFALGTTAVTNCLAEQAGAPTGLLVTRGFADLWTMARGHRRGVDGMSHPLPVLVPRRRVGEVGERVDRDGGVLEPLDEDGAVHVVDRLVGEEGCEALAVCLLWSFRHPEHERRVASLARARHPRLHVSVSADLLPVAREYERMTTAVLNAYTAGAVAGFLDTLEARLGAAGLRVPVALMQSNGGTCTAAEARARPILLAQSGPVAGIAAAEALAHTAGIADLVTGDVGGTSFDVAIIHRGAALRRVRAPVAGLATGLAMVAVDSIGAGGGSIGWRDARGVLRVGPRSAGAEPGPACYGRGGREPAVTDALVALGLLDPGHFLGGRLLLDGESAVGALARLGAGLGLHAEATARGMWRLAAEQMTLAVKGLLGERGLDPRRFAFLCYGGCGALFGVAVARALGMPRVIVPALAAVFSASGAATAEVRREAVETVFHPLPIAPDALGTAFATLEARVHAALAEAGVDVARVALRHEADLRFHGQGWEVTVPVTGAGAAAGLAATFRARYAELYGTGALAAAAGIDLVNCRVIGTVAQPRPALASPVAPGSADAESARRGVRMAWLPGAGEARARLAVYDGERLAPGMRLPGPALIERDDTTILIGTADTASVDAAGSLVVEVAGG